MENSDIDKPVYGVRVFVKKPDTGETIVAKGVAHELILGRSDYASTVIMPDLNSGKYKLEVYAFVPFAHIGERESLEMEVID
jgi:hypothetical protein